MINGGKSTALKGDMQVGGEFFVGEKMSEWYSNDLLRCMGGMDDGECGSQPLQ
jgi:hypothetical protein